LPLHLHGDSKKTGGDVATAASQRSATAIANVARSMARVHIVL
jgi:hypothetical protein